MVSLAEGHNLGATCRDTFREATSLDATRVSAIRTLAFRTS
jgi:hypothetical protein